MIASRFTLLLLLGAISQAAFSQNYIQHILGNPDTTERGYAVEVLSDGRLLLGGYSEQMGFSPVNAVLLLLDGSGQEIWGKSIDLGVQEQVSALRIAADGNILALLTTFPASSKPLTSFSAVARIDPVTGSVLEIKKFVGAASSLTHMTPISGGYLLTGSIWQAAGSQPLPVAVKINESLGIEWQVALTGGPVAGGNLRGAWENDSKTMIYAAGEVDGPNGEKDGLLVRFGIAGSFDCRSIGSPGPDALTQVTAAKNNHIFWSGHTPYFSNLYQEIWVAETDETATSLLESHTYGLQNQDNDLFATGMLAMPGDQHLISTGGAGQMLGSHAAFLWLSQGNEVLSSSKDYGNQTEGSGFESIRLLPGGKGFAAAGTWYDQFGYNLFLSQMHPDGSVDQACCPKDLKVNVRDVTQDIKITTITPDAVQPLLIQPAAFLSAPYHPANQSICIPIDLGFSLSDSTIRPTTFVDIKETGNTPGVTYTYEIGGDGRPDPNHPARVYFNHDGSITRVGSNQYCTLKKTIPVSTMVSKDLLPNAFTPNGDQLNDVFKPIFPCPVLVSDMKIYDRWGKLVFETKDPNAGWDGLVKGQEAPSDVYVWSIEYEAERGNGREKYFLKGQVSLLR